jgi:hypothetical protein
MKRPIRRHYAEHETRAQITDWLAHHAATQLPAGHALGVLVAEAKPRRIPRPATPRVKGKKARPITYGQPPVAALADVKRAAKHIAAKWNRPDLVDDLVHVGWLELSRVYPKWKPAISKLWTFARRFVENAMAQEVARAAAIVRGAFANQMQPYFDDALTVPVAEPSDAAWCEIDAVATHESYTAARTVDGLDTDDDVPEHVDAFMGDDEGHDTVSPAAAAERDRVEDALIAWLDAARNFRNTHIN